MPIREYHVKLTRAKGCKTPKRFVDVPIERVYRKYSIETKAMPPGTTLYDKDCKFFQRLLTDEIKRNPTRRTLDVKLIITAG